MIHWVDFFPHKHMSAALSKVYDLYALQVELFKIIDQELKNPEKQKEARKHVRAFAALLKEVDPKYMGGEDVYHSFVEIHEEAKTKLKKAKK